MKATNLTITLLLTAALLAGCSNSADDKAPAPTSSESTSSPAETSSPTQPKTPANTAEPTEAETGTQVTPEAPSTLPQTLAPKPGESPSELSDIPVEHRNS